MVMGAIVVIGTEVDDDVCTKNAALSDIGHAAGQSGDELVYGV
jgi:hypothetical protein